MKRIGHKGADSIRPGNTLESFEAAVAAGAEMIELDVLRPRADFRDGGDWRRAVVEADIHAPGSKHPRATTFDLFLIKDQWRIADFGE